MRESQLKVVLRYRLGAVNAEWRVLTKDEMRIARQDAWFSKDVIVTAVASVAVASTWGMGLPFAIPAALTATGAPVTLGGIIGAKNKFASTRKAIMNNHPMAYLYELQQFSGH